MTASVVKNCAAWIQRELKRQRTVKNKSELPAFFLSLPIVGELSKELKENVRNQVLALLFG